MPKSSITQLVSAAKSELAYDDLLIGTIPGKTNYKINLQNFVGYLKDYSTPLFPIQFNESYINFNNTSSSVSLTNKNINEIETVTFDDNGCVVNITDKSTPVSDRTDYYMGSISTVDFAFGSQWGRGYFDKYFRPQANSHKAITNPTIRYSNNISYTTTTGDWSLLFDKSYEGFRKSIITYNHARLDTSGSNETNSYYTFYIYWDGENKTKVLGTNLIEIQDDYYLTGSYIWKPQILQDNNAYKPVESYSILSQNRNIHLLQYIEVDGKNKKINKLPMVPIVAGANRETHTISITIENFA